MTEIVYMFKPEICDVPPARPLMDRLIQLANGNIGAVTVLRQLHRFSAFEVIDMLEDFELKGDKIWVGYKNVCDQSLAKFAEFVMNDPQLLILKIEEYY